MVMCDCVSGTSYQGSVDYNMNLSIFGYSHYNPNEPMGVLDKNQSMIGEVGGDQFRLAGTH